MKFPLLALLVFSIAACTEPITIGSDILDEQGEVGQLDDFPFEMRVVRDDSLRVYSRSRPFSVGQGFFPARPVFSFGQITDPVFGSWQHAVTLTPSLVVNRTQFNTDEVLIPEFALDDRPLIDSIVIILQIDTTRAPYGPEQENYAIPARLMRLTAQESEEEERFSSAPPPTQLGENILSGSTIIASPSNRPIFDSAYAASVPEAPHIRLKLTQAFVDEMNQLDSADFATDTIFRETFAGAYLEPTADSEALINLRLIGGAAGFSDMYFFYEDPSENDSASFYRAPLRSWFPRYEYDYTGSVAANLLADQSDQEILLVGGGGSLATKITFPDRSSLSNALINRAELVTHLTSIEGYDYDRFSASPLLGLFYRNNAGDLVGIQDLEVLGRMPTPDIVNTFLGGFQEMTGDSIFYRNLLSRHLQGIIDDDFAEPALYLRPPAPLTNPSRAIIRGSTAAELTVTFTRGD